MTHIDEPNLYRCILQSRKAEAENTATDLTVNVSFTLFICMVGRCAKGVTFCP